MSYLLDTNILVRLANSADTLYPDALRAVLKLHNAGETLHITPQNLVEFRGVATRPISTNGLGLMPAAVELRQTDFRRSSVYCPRLPTSSPHGRCS